VPQTQTCGNLGHAGWEWLGERGQQSFADKTPSGPVLVIVAKCRPLADRRGGPGLSARSTALGVLFSGAAAPGVLSAGMAMTAVPVPCLHFALLYGKGGLRGCEKKILRRRSGFARRRPPQVLEGRRSRAEQVLVAGEGVEKKLREGRVSCR